MCYNQNDKNLKFYVEMTFISRAIPIKAKGSANYESPCIFDFFLIIHVFSVC